MKKVFYSYYLRVAFRKNVTFSGRIQCLLQWFGIAIHNPWRDECCCDFECCAPLKQDSKNHCWLHISAKSLPIRRIVWYEETAPVGTPGRTFVKKTKWKFGKYL
jgi:hypothetical protein